MLKNTSSGFAPSVRAACSSRGSMASIDRRMARTISGNDITAAAMAAPCQVKATVTSNVASSQAPIGPFRPNRTSRM